MSNKDMRVPQGAGPWYSSLSCDLSCSLSLTHSISASLLHSIVLTALKQDALRRNEKRGWCMEQLALAISTGSHEGAASSSTKGRKGSMVEDKEKDSDDSIVVTGFYLDGASWSSKDSRLVEVGQECSIAFH